MKAIATLFDSVNTVAKEVEKSTRRKKRLTRQHLTYVFNAARTIVNLVAPLYPKAAPVAVVLNQLNASPKKKKKKSKKKKTKKTPERLEERTSEETS